MLSSERLVCVEIDILHKFSDTVGTVAYSLQPPSSSLIDPARNSGVESPLNQNRYSELTAGLKVRN